MKKKVLQFLRKTFALTRKNKGDKPLIHDLESEVRRYASEHLGVKVGGKCICNAVKKNGRIIDRAMLPLLAVIANYGYRIEGCAYRVHKRGIDLLDKNGDCFSTLLPSYLLDVKNRREVVKYKPSMSVVRNKTGKKRKANTPQGMALRNAIANKLEAMPLLNMSSFERNYGLANKSLYDVRRGGGKKNAIAIAYALSNECGFKVAGHTIEGITQNKEALIIDGKEHNLTQINALYAA